MITSILNIDSLNNGSIKDLLAKAEGDVQEIEEILENEF
jgi:hypothetical protein